MEEQPLTFVEDANGNRANFYYWGSAGAAKAALAALKNCKNCIDCSGCSECSDCSRCSGKKNNIGDHLQPPIPVIENIHQTVFAVVSQPDALDMSDWHTCDTTHCRAGWVVTLAGEEGKALESYWTTNHAAWLIYKASDPSIKSRPNFFCDNAIALADMKRLADDEAARTAAK